MNILGLHYGHDGSACVIKDGKLITAISSERITRKKKFGGLTKDVIQYVLEEADLKIDDIDLIALSDYIEQFSFGTLELFEENKKVINTCQTVFGDTVKYLKGKLFNKEIPVVVIPHHLSHCASTYYTSNFNDAWCFSMDSSFGSLEANSLIARGIGNKLWTVECPGLMVGVGYAVFTKNLGLGSPLYKAGTTMGLASYGEPNTDLLSNIEKYVQESFFSTSDYEKYYSELFLKWSRSNRPLTKDESSKPEAMMLAASIQHLFEQCLLEVLNNRIKTDDTNNLCLAGGSLLNCNANSVIRKGTRFTNIHHFPACGDDGICVGAALYAAHHINDEPRVDYKTNEVCYLGKQQSMVEPDYELLANMIANGKIIAWFMGKSEYGPRALGNRSILADPRNFHNRELINFVVKNREWFRPFAPAVLEEHYKDWFDFDSVSPYMLYTANVLRPKDIPAVTHIDGTARFQTVNKDSNPYFYNLISNFYKLTGVPILLNTSLNGNGQPILETELDALEFLKSSNVDALVINGKIIQK